MSGVTCQVSHVIFSFSFFGQSGEVSRTFTRCGLDVRTEIFQEPENTLSLQQVYTTHISFSARRTQRNINCPEEGVIGWLLDGYWLVIGWLLCSRGNPWGKFSPPTSQLSLLWWRHMWQPFSILSSLPECLLLTTYLFCRNNLYFRPFQLNFANAPQHKPHHCLWDWTPTSRINDPTQANQAIRQTTDICEKSRLRWCA